MSLLHGHRDGPLPNPKALSHWGKYFAFGEGLQGAVGLPRFEHHDDKLALWARQAPAAHTTRCCSPGLPWTLPTPCAHVRGGRRRPVDKRAIMARPG